MASSKLEPLITKLIPNLRLSAGTIRHLLPKFAKLLICLLFLLNIRSWPLMWHFRVFRRVFILRLYYKWRVSICSIFSSPSVKLKTEDDWWDSISPIGEDPFRMVVPYRSWASFDECDFNGHLSNSSYAKTLDTARFKTALGMFPMFFRAGGWMPLSATHYHFIREIPMLASYEVRTSIAAWDQKWLYVTSKFVRKSDGKKKHTATKSASPENGEVPSISVMSLQAPSVDAISLTDTPLPTSTPGDPTTPQLDTELEIALKAVTAGLKAVTADLIDEEPDGAILHTIVISQVCFKIGRITVPPAVVFAVNGFTGTSGHSLANPHPEWSKAERTMSGHLGGSSKKLKKFLAGGWRDIPESERWWDKPLGERIEAQRLKNISMIIGLRRGLEKAREL